MTIDPQMLRSEQHQEIGRLIEEGVDELVLRWSRRAVAEQPQARRVHEQDLRDHLPTFLRILAHGLADLTSPDACPHCAAAIDHGEQRWQAGWSLTEVVRDYQILRLVLTDFLEERLGRPLLLREGQAIGLALDEAIGASVSTYVRQRDEYLAQVEQERAERQRQAEEGQLRWDRVFQNAGWGIALLRPEEGTLQVVNPAFARLHGRTPEQIQGLALAELVAPEARGELAGHFARADRDGQHAYESLHCRADGTPFPVLAQLSTIADKEGRPLYRALNLQDVTASKQTEAFLRDQARALAESDKRKNEFLAVLAHELRNPLAPILTSVRVLGLLGSAEPPVAQAREIIERQARQLARLVDDLLDVTRIAQGKLELRRGRFDLSAAVTEAVQQTAPLVEGAGQQLVVRLPPGPLPLEADQARIVQVVVNLLNNAAKYTDRGGHIELSAAQEGEEVVLRVRDNGVGIAREMLGRVFDLFTQVEGAAQRAQGGLGIGLTLVRRLVELHGGTVSAHSEGVGRGSEFSVRLPAAPSDPAEGGLGSEAAPSSTVSRHVLIIEDEADNRATLATLLRLLGHRVEVAANGREGVERALAGRPEVALVDLRLPLLDGYEVARQVRAALGGGVRLIALTGSATEEDRQRSREAGFDAHLAKPVDPEQLERLLSRTE